MHRVAPAVEAAVIAADADIEASAKELSELPGAAARCPHCRTRMRMKRVKDGRKWWTMWVCGRCGQMYRPADFPASARAAGWQ